MRKLMKLLSLLAVASCVLLGNSVWADTTAATPAPTASPTPVVTIDGLVDTYYSYNFNSPSGSGSFSPAAPTLSGNGFRNFDVSNNSFTLGLVELNLTATMGEATGYLDFAYGQTANIVGLPYNLRQAYVEWKTGNLTLDGGQFVTHMGQEVIGNQLNWNYSRSFLFSYAIPYFHTGLRATYAFDPKFSAQVNVYDGWNSTFASDASGQKTYGWMLMGTPDPSLSIMFNGIYGPIPTFGTTATPYGPAVSSAMRFVGEGIVTWNATDKLSFAVDYNYGSDDTPEPGVVGDIWSGLAAYARYQIQSDWAVAARGEEYVDHHGTTLALPMGAALWEGTLTLEHTISSNLLVRLEGRYDMAQDPNSGSSLKVFSPASAPSSNELTTTLGAIYSF